MGGKNLGLQLDVLLIIMLKQITFFLALASVSFLNQAQSQSEIDAFIQQSEVKPYDCPEQTSIDQVTQYLTLPDLTKIQRVELQTMHTHAQICAGNYEQAKQTLLNILSDPPTNPTPKYYVYATYQLGFIYDIQENPERCELYTRAQNLANGQFVDLHLSASLGLITMCNANNDEGVKLGKMYALLESYSKQNDAAALAHIHNNIGLLYAQLGQHVLAAEQFQKSYELGFDSYTGSNQLATLISVISSHMASGNFAKAAHTIEEFKRINRSVDTTLSNVWLHFAEAGYHYRTGNMNGLRDSLAKWRVYLDQMNSTMHEGLYRWYNAVLCFDGQDKACVLQFLKDEDAASDGYKAFINSNKDYLKFQVEIQLWLGDLEQAKVKFDTFAAVMFDKVVQQQASAKVLGVANLHAKISDLESSLVASQTNRMRTVWAIVMLSVVVLVVVIYLARRKYISSLAYDSVTGLLSSRSALNKIRRISAPSPGRTNALALFDLGNFREVNRQIGAANSDVALQQIAKTLSKVTRKSDILGRFAPEQFIVCLTDIEEDSAKSFLERMRFALENTVLGEQRDLKVSVQSSMSIFIASEAFGNLDQVLNEMQLSLGIRSDN